MRTFINPAFIVPTLLVVACQNGQPTLDTFSSEIGAFTIAAPAPFEEVQQSVETPVGPVDIYTFTAETNHSAYVVAFSDYPIEMVDQSNPESLLNSSRDGAINNLGGTLVSEEMIEVSGYPGRSLVIAAQGPTNQPATINSHIYLVDNRLYQILVVSPDNQKSTLKPQTFLESFKLD